jgi:hypothetical protein
METAALSGVDDRLVGTGVRRLTPATTTVFEGTFSLLHCQVKDDNCYRGVFALLLFPISQPDRNISLRYTDLEDKDQEIGVIECLSDFPAVQQQLIKQNLVKQYYEQRIQRIHGIKCLYGLLFFQVETQRGAEEFVMPWRHDRAEDFGADGKVLLDSLDNRYIIPEVSKLPASDRRLFLGFIYW